jgi:hypothetical protein
LPDEVPFFCFVLRGPGEGERLRAAAAAFFLRVAAAVARAFFSFFALMAAAAALALALPAPTAAAAIVVVADVDVAADAAAPAAPVVIVAAALLLESCGVVAAGGADAVAAPAGANAVAAPAAAAVVALAAEADAASVMATSPSVSPPSSPRVTRLRFWVAAVAAAMAPDMMIAFLLSAAPRQQQRCACLLPAAAMNVGPKQQTCRVPPACCRTLAVCLRCLLALQAASWNDVSHTSAQEPKLSRVRVRACVRVLLLFRACVRACVSIRETTTCSLACLLCC